jgi:ankyrin repeat protein
MSRITRIIEAIEHDDIGKINRIVLFSLGNKKELIRVGFNNALRCNKFEIADYFINKNPDLALVNELNEYIEHRDNKVAEYLIKKLKEHQKDSRYLKRNMESAFLAAIRAENLDIMKYLIDCGVDINAPEPYETLLKYDSPAIIYALHNKKFKAARYLVENGADLRVKDVKGDTSLLLAIRKGCPFDLIELLVKKGDIVNEHGEAYRTPLTAAIDLDHYTCIKLLLDNGANPYAKGNNEHEPIFYALHRKPPNDEVIKLFLQFPYDQELLLETLYRGANIEVVKILLDLLKTRDTNNESESDLYTLEDVYNDIVNTSNDAVKRKSTDQGFTGLRYGIAADNEYFFYIISTKADEHTCSYYKTSSGAFVREHDYRDYYS